MFDAFSPRLLHIPDVFLMKEEFGVLDPWDEYDRWWWRQFGDDHIWGRHFPEEGRGETPPRRPKNRLEEK